MFKYYATNVFCFILISKKKKKKELLSFHRRRDLNWMLTWLYAKGWFWAVALHLLWSLVDHIAGEISLIGLIYLGWKPESLGKILTVEKVAQNYLNGVALDFIRWNEIQM